MDIQNITYTVSMSLIVDMDMLTRTTDIRDVYSNLGKAPKFLVL